MSFLSPEAPKVADVGKEQAKTRDERLDLLKRSRIDQNTTTQDKQLGTPAKTFRSVLGR